MKKSIYLIIGLTISLTISLNGQVINNQESDKMEGINRKSAFNLEEIKVRWKKAALENCTGVPCTTASSCTAGTPSSSPTVVNGSALTPITIVTTGVSSIVATGLSNGITATLSGNVITISGTPSVSCSGAGTFPYTISLGGGCGNLTVTGTITILVYC